MARSRSIAASVASVLAVLTVLVAASIGLGGEAWALRTAACPYGYNHDGTCRAEPFAPPSRPTRQRVTFRSEPPGAAIFIDGEPLLRKDGTPATTDYTHTQKLPPKLSLIELRLDGYEPAKIWHRIERFGRQEIEHRLVPLVPVKVHNLTDVACDLEVERMGVSPASGLGGALPQQVGAVPESWVSLRRRVLPARTTITVELVGPGSYELSCSADSYRTQCTAVDLSLTDGEWSVVQHQGCGDAVGEGAGRRDASVDVRLEPREACIQIDPDVPDVPLQVWAVSDPALGCGEAPPGATVGPQWWTRRAAACGSDGAVPFLEEDGVARPWEQVAEARGGARGGRLGLIEFGGARYGDTVCIRVPSIPDRADIEVPVDGLTKVVGLTLWPTDDAPEVVSLRAEDATVANQHCVDEGLPAAERARECAHLAFLLEASRAVGQPVSRGRLRRRLSAVSVLPADPQQLWARACEGGDARACEAAGIRAQGCGEQRCPEADARFERACALGRETACIRRVSSWADGLGLDSLYRLANDHPLVSGEPSTSTKRLGSKTYRQRPGTLFLYPAVQLGFDPRDAASSYQVQASWLNLFVRSPGGVFGGWIKGAVPTLISFEQRVIEGGVVSTRRVYGGQIGLEAIARVHAELLRKRPTEVLLFLSGGVGYGLAWVDGFRLSGDALAGAGLSINGWGLDAGVRTLRAPYTRTELDGQRLRSSAPRLGVYVSLETNFDLRRR